MPGPLVFGRFKVVTACISSLLPIINNYSISYQVPCFDESMNCLHLIHFINIVHYVLSSLCNRSVRREASTLHKALVHCGDLAYPM
jgi:hypothetical protein